MNRQQAIEYLKGLQLRFSEIGDTYDTNGLGEVLAFIDDTYEELNEMDYKKLG